MNRYILYSALGAFLLGCQEYSVDVPEYQREGNLIALFTPGEPLELKVGFTGLGLEEIEDTNRVASTLYRDGQLADEFSLRSSHVVNWGSSYRLEVVIDGTYELSGRIQIGDSIKARVLDTIELDETVIGRQGQPYNFVKPVLVNANNAGYSDSVYIYETRAVNSSGREIIAHGRPYFSLAANFSDTLIFHTIIAESGINITLLGPEYYRYLQRVDEQLQVDEHFSPNPVSYTNIEGGAGLMSLYYPFTPN